jgi:hypothetical protein
VYWRDGEKGGGVVIWCKQCSFLVNFRLKYKDIYKSNKRQTYTHCMGVLGGEMGKFYTKTRRKLKKNMPRRIFFQVWFPFRVTEFPVEGAFSIGWWCYITPVSPISCPNIELCQLFHWPKNVNKSNLVFLHILECTIRNTFLTNIDLGRLSDIASHCKKYINII